MLASLCLLLAAGCPGAPQGGGEGEGEKEPPGQLVESDKARVIAPEVPGEDLNEVVAGNSAFALDLYQQVRGEDGNIFYSPYSISVALAMTYAGARTETEQEMAETMTFTLPQDRLHPAFNGLDQELASRGQDAEEADDEGFQLNIVNQLWGQAGFSFLEPFLDVLAENYGAGMRLLDFAADPEASRVQINDWVADQTEDRIQNLIPRMAITTTTRLVLTNAIYFKATWSKQFDEGQTQDGPFNLLDGSQVTLPLMQQVETFAYTGGEGYQAVELPYEGNELSMVILLPDAGQLEGFEAGLDVERLEGILQSLDFRDLDLTMPRFTFEWSASLKQVLSAMGMPLAFSAADFSGITEAAALAIQDVIHKAFVAVDEEGTEAAAATAVIIGETAVPEPVDPLVVRIDRPFLLLIQDRATGTVLFLGRVTDPTTG
jgi:serpin B